MHSPRNGSGKEVEGGGERINSIISKHIKKKEGEKKKPSANTRMVEKGNDG